jgi:hypothetical protein
MVNDYKTLAWIMNIKKAGSKLLGWRIKLEKYDYKVVYKGALNTCGRAKRNSLNAKGAPEEKRECVTEMVTIDI